MQPGVIDENHRVRLLVAEVAIGAEDQADEREDIEKHVEKPHDRQVDQGIEQLRPGLAHLRAAEADKLDLWQRARRASIKLAPCKSPLGSPAEMKIRMVDSRFRA